MRKLKLAAAQSASVPGDVLANLDRHLSFAKAAAHEAVSFLLFPELSLTGYELHRLNDCIVSPNDLSLMPIRDFSRRAGMTIVLGAPVAPEIGGKPAIGAICCHPDGTTTTYRKRFLHEGEEAFASPGTVNVHRLEMKGQQLALAICADTVNPEHPRWAREAGATIYAAGVLWSSSGYAADAALIQEYSATHGLAALVANHAIPTGGYASAGQSAFWKPGGQLLCVAPKQGSVLLVAQAQDDDWLCSCRTVDA